MAMGALVCALFVFRLVRAILPRRIKVPPIGRDELQAEITKHIATMRDLGATGNPADYVDGLMYVPPRDAQAIDGIGLVCICCCGLFATNTRADGLWVSAHKTLGTPLPMCAFCILWLARRSGPASFKLRPQYDPVGQQLANGFGDKEPAQAAVVRMMLLKNRVDRLTKGGH